MDILFAITGLVILLLAGDVLVRGAVNLGLRLGIPALIVSLTIVAFGTSAPELLIAVQAALEGVPGIALGNVVGSNIANVLMVLGVPALVSGIYCSQCDSRKTYVFMLITSVVFIGLCYMGPLHFWHAGVLLLMLFAMLAEAFWSAHKHRKKAADDCDPELADIEEADPEMPGWRIAVYLILGLIGLPLGAELLIDGALEIAKHLGVSDSVIGLTLVAVGTSLPELATTVSAALRRRADVVLGNVIGSNMFNILAIMGVASLFGPLEVPTNILHIDLWIMLAASLAIAPFVIWGANMTRRWGAIFSALYVGYVIFLLT